LKETLNLREENIGGGLTMFKSDCKEFTLVYMIRVSGKWLVNKLVVLHVGHACYISLVSDSTATSWKVGYSFLSYYELQFDPATRSLLLHSFDKNVKTLLGVNDHNIYKSLPSSIDNYKAPVDIPEHSPND